MPVENFDVTSYNDERRNTSQSRIRGGRSAETQTLIDGIPVNNVLFGDNGTGMQVHFSLWKGEKPLFTGNKYAGLSDMGLHAIGGILKQFEYAIVGLLAAIAILWIWFRIIKPRRMRSAA